jgi:diguanylate cyclase (GGDEF)-like protein
LKILLADDDPISRRIVERMLQALEYEVVTAENGQQAIDRLSRDDSPRLALLDWMMPELDGLEVCREIRSHAEKPYVYILLLTSRESSEDVVTGLEAGADEYLTKPCRHAELRARLHTGRRILMLEDKLIEAREAMRFRATHDTLTSLSDRGSIMAQLEIELSRSQVMRCPISLLLCDIDHFKQVNDVHGHLVGDEVLRQVSDRLTRSIRSGDSVGRYGGEEFLIILQSCDRNGLAQRAEQIRNSIGSLGFSTRNGPLPVSMSIGATTIEYWNAAMPIEALLMEADEALYRAKAAGRNRVIYSDSSPKTGETRAHSVSLN